MVVVGDNNGRYTYDSFFFFFFFFSSLSLFYFYSFISILLLQFFGQANSRSSPPPPPNGATCPCVLVGSVVTYWCLRVNDLFNSDFCCTLMCAESFNACVSSARNQPPRLILFDRNCSYVFFWQENSFYRTHVGFGHNIFCKPVL